MSITGCAASSCRISCTDCNLSAAAYLDTPPNHALKAGRQPAPLRLRFVIEPDIGDEFGSCARRLQKLSGSRLAPELGVLDFNAAQHAVDVPLLAGLRELLPPRHIRQEALSQVDLRVLPALPLASFLVEQTEGGNLSRHRARMDALAQRLQEDQRFLSRLEPFLLLYPSGYAEQHLGEKLTRTLLLGNVILASIDPSWGVFPQHLVRRLAKEFAPLLRRAITLPYLPHPFAVSPKVEGGARPFDVMYEGGLHRSMDFGTRARMAAVLQAMPRQSRVHLSVPEGDKYHRQQASQALLFDSSADIRSAALTNYSRSGAAFSNARVCAVPMGDTLTTRRLFDSLQAGCVPLIVRSSYVMRTHNKPELNLTFRTSLPFAASIDWERASLRFNPTRTCKAQDVSWLDRLFDVRCPLLEAKRAYGAAIFDAHLDVRNNPSGVATALLREIQESGVLDTRRRTVAGM